MSEETHCSTHCSDMAHSDRPYNYLCSDIFGVAVSPDAFDGWSM